MAFADRNCDVGAVSFALTELVNRVGDVLIPAARAAMSGQFSAVMGQYR